VPLSGRLVAEHACAAVVSIKKGSNPDSARLVPGRSYEVLGKNREDPTHYQVTLEGSRPPERWVEIECGTLLRTSGATAVPEAVAPPPVPERRESLSSAELPAIPEPSDTPSPPGHFVLAVTWQPAFCELRSRRPECRDEGGHEPEAVVFSLHGLWPQPGDRIYCAVPEDRREQTERLPWSRLPRADLSEGTRERLREAMPGTLSNLDRHEWIKHGTCYGTDADTYYRHALALLDRLNDSAVRTLFAERLGRSLRAREIRTAFDRAFGRGTGDRVQVSCDEGMITELRLGLRGPVSAAASLSELMRAAPTVSPGCRVGRVDAPGPD